MNVTVDLEKDWSKWGQFCEMSGSAHVLFYICSHLAKTGKRVKTLHVPGDDWYAFTGACAQKVAIFSFVGEKGCIEIAPAGYKVQVFCDLRLGKHEWRYFEEPFKE